LERSNVRTFQRLNFICVHLWQIKKGSDSNMEDQVIYNPPELKKAAEALAEATPQHLGQPTTPIIRWRVDGDQLRVLLADGRTVRGPLPEKKGKTRSSEASPIMTLPVHPTVTPDKAMPAGKGKK
jgi:hypothetical protein